MQVVVGCVVVVGLLCLPDGSVAASREGLRLAVIANADNPRHDQVVRSLSQALAVACGEPCPSPPQLQRLDADAATEAISATAAELLVGIGSDALERLARYPGEEPRLYGFIPQVAWQEQAACCAPLPDRSSAIFIDQPFERQFALIRQVAPGVRAVGVLLGEVSASQRGQLLVAAEGAGLELHLQQTNDASEIGSRLRRLAESCDALLAVPDPAIYNRDTIHSILLTSYGARLPLFGFSDAMVKAGAVAAVYTTPGDAGREIASAILSYRDSALLGGARHGRSFSLSVNREVARSLRLNPPPESQLLKQIKGVEQ
jgi:hypothetical protein